MESLHEAFTTRTTRRGSGPFGVDVTCVVSGPAAATPPGSAVIPTEMTLDPATSALITCSYPTYSFGGIAADETEHLRAGRSGVWKG